MPVQNSALQNASKNFPNNSPSRLSPNYKISAGILYTILKFSIVPCLKVVSGLGQNMLLSKNPQIFSDHYEILTKEGTLEDLILTKFRNDWVKIVDFLIKAYFCYS